MKEKDNNTLVRLLAIGSLVGATAYFLTACRSSKPLETVRRVDIKKYAGKWFEIASFPSRFQKNCTCTTAEYTINDDGTVAVDNRCYNAKKKKWEGITGKAFVRNDDTNAELAVQFFWPLKGDYYIIALADDYSYAMIGVPSRDYLWILSRKREMPQSTFEKLSAIAIKKGFDVSRLRRTKQNNCD
ncbi:lipocalin family protein [Persicitalea sp.]|uniref:lipocalin family protein n=1 Tax=Persicitalea sp. TaxID=3100273 RepID=UPI003594638D